MHSRGKSRVWGTSNCISLVKCGLCALPGVFQRQGGRRYLGGKKNKEEGGGWGIRRGRYGSNLAVFGWRRVQGDILGGKEGGEVAGAVRAHQNKEKKKKKWKERITIKNSELAPKIAQEGDPDENRV